MQLINTLWLSYHRPFIFMKYLTKQFVMASLAAMESDYEAEYMKIHDT